MSVDFMRILCRRNTMVCLGCSKHAVIRCRQAVVGVICATLPIIVSCITVGVITSVKNYPAAIPDTLYPDTLGANYT